MRTTRWFLLLTVVFAAASVPAFSAPPQSPVNVLGGTKNKKLPKPIFDYPNVDLTMKTYNLPATGAGVNDHPAKKKIEATTSKIAATDNSPTLTLPHTPNQVYQLKEIHFHGPSEHKLIDSEGDEVIEFAMEMHMVHQRVGVKNGAYLAVGRWIIVTPIEGTENFELDQMLDTLPNMPAVGPNPNTLPPINNFTLSVLLPADLSSYRYNGSLTTFGTNGEKNAVPPTSNTPVKWIMFDEPLLMTQTQIDKFLNHAATTGARPIQNIIGGHNLRTDVGGVPEPSTIWLLALAGLLARPRQKR
jgi:carbonic anhydrase